MDSTGASAIVTGGASGLGLATAHRVAACGAVTIIVDLTSSDGAAAAASIGSNAFFVAADVTDAEALEEAVDVAASRAPLRAAVHCAGRGGTVRVLDREGQPG